MEPGLEPSRDPDGEADAAQAFAALCQEVAALRRGIELVHRQQQAGAGGAGAAEAPDYSPTLGAIVQELRGMDDRLAEIEAQPALRVTAAAQAGELRRELHQAGEDARQGFARAQDRMDNATHELRKLIGSAHEQFAQQRREWLAVGFGVVLGLALWLPLAWIIPFGGGDWLAAKAIGGGRWQAGETLMREADPVASNRMARLYNACPQDSATELCEAAMAVRTASPAAASRASEGAGAPAFGTVPGPAHSKSGQRR